jgi:SAM-dependent methyltransferase
MRTPFFNSLVDRAAAPYRQAGRFAYHFARGKLGRDSLFRHLLKMGVFPRSGHFLDLGCGQAVFASLLLAARATYEHGQWPTDWPPPPQILSLHGIELMDSDVRRARSVFAADHPLVRIRQGDICRENFPSVDVLTILDVFQYIEFAEQETILRKVRAALPPGGLFVTRIGDAAAGLPFHICNWVDQAVTFTRGHRLPKLYCRPLSEWLTLLHAHGFEVETTGMSHGKPFANVMLLARVPVAPAAKECII